MLSAKKSIAAKEINSFMGEEYDGLKITFSDLNTCINLNSTVKDLDNCSSRMKTIAHY